MFSIFGSSWEGEDDLSGMVGRKDRKEEGWCGVKGRAYRLQWCIFETGRQREDLNGVNSLEMESMQVSKVKRTRYQHAEPCSQFEDSYKPAFKTSIGDRIFETGFERAHRQNTRKDTLT